MHCHHEKTIVVDDQVAFVGGIDLTNLAGDRFDTSEHDAARKIGWHNVATKLEGPVVGDVADHFVKRWREVTGETLATPVSSAPAGEVMAQVVRTVPEGIYDAVADGDFRALETCLRTLRDAQRFIYLQNQFPWSPEIVDALRKLRDPRHDDFRLVVPLPAKPNNGQGDARGQLAVLAAADDHAARSLAVTARSRHGDRTDPLYVHPKVAIVDDDRLIVRSANLNEHSLVNDTEMCVVTDDTQPATATCRRLWTGHFECDETELGGEPVEVVDERSRPIAQDQLERPRHGRPPTHRLIELPSISKRTDRSRGPFAGLFVDG